jgi:hypothetical protein
MLPRIRSGDVSGAGATRGEQSDHSGTEVVNRAGDLSADGGRQDGLHQHSHQALHQERLPDTAFGARATDPLAKSRGSGWIAPRWPCPVP